MRRLTTLVVLAVAMASVGRISASALPVVVAIDTSRSLSTADVASIRSSLSDEIRRLPTDAAVGVIAFDDSARWLLPIGGDRAAAFDALNRLEPGGRFTVLHDALFLAARELKHGGIVVLASDGRDENSATTVEDVARLCERQQVRIIATAIGKRVDQRAMRRLVLLSRGEYLGPLQEAPAGQLAATIAELSRSPVARALPTEQATHSEPTSTLQETDADEREPSEPDIAIDAPRFPWSLVILTGLAGLALVVLTLVWLSRRRLRSERRCEECGTLLADWETSCAQCQVAELEEAARTQLVASEEVSDEAVLDPKVFEKAPLPQGLDQTMTLDELPVLVSRQRGRPSRSYTLPREKVFAVGRAADINTLQIKDPTISAQHFKLVPKNGDYYVVDLDTTNGTLVNHERVKVRKLIPGDVIRAGTVEFEFDLKVRRAG